MEFTRENIVQYMGDPSASNYQRPNDQEVDAFYHMVTTTGLDPVAKHIYSIGRYDKRARRTKYTTQVGIDGFRVIAIRTGEYDGREGPFWLTDEGEWVDYWLDPSKKPVAAKVAVGRKGCSRPVTAVAHWAEYGSTGNMWASMPAHMLAKCAEALALRACFPDHLSGLYTSDEMAQASTPDLTNGHQSEPEPAPERVERPAFNPNVDANGEPFAEKPYRKLVVGMLAHVKQDSPEKVADLRKSLKLLDVFASNGQVKAKITVDQYKACMQTLKDAGFDEPFDVEPQGDAEEPVVEPEPVDPKVAEAKRQIGEMKGQLEEEAEQATWD